jgi:hypothetical protein
MPDTPRLMSLIAFKLNQVRDDERAFAQLTANILVTVAMAVMRVYGPDVMLAEVTGIAEEVARRQARLAAN